MSLLQLPSGSATLFLQEARNHQLLVQELNALYDSWAYLPVHTPLVDYSKAYEGLASDKDLKRVYHLVDRDGEILMLRWDITLFLVKQVRGLLAESQGPLRLCYADSILRHQEAEDISKNEFFQTGVELIGRAGPDGDLEVLLLLHNALGALGLPASVHVGSRAVFQAAFGQLPADVQAGLGRAIQFRDRPTLRALLAASFAAPRAAALESLFCLIGEPAEARARVEALKPGLDPELFRQAAALCDFTADAKALEAGLQVHVDFSEFGSMGYQTGVVFQAYLASLDTPVASGGRYDGLLERLGCPAPAVGFSIMLSKVASRARLPGAAPAEPVSPAATEFAGRYREAARLRAAGKRVSL
jgi:ATP phosphoribosyltransferase regulatory subunit